MGEPANPMDNHVRHNSLCAVITMDTRSWNEKTVKSSVTETETEIDFYCQSQITILKNSSKRTSHYKIMLVNPVRSNKGPVINVINSSYSKYFIASLFSG